MTKTKLFWRRSLCMIFCVILIFSLFPFTAYADTAFTLAEGESIVLNLKEGEYLIVRRGQGMCVPFMAAYSEAAGQ